MPVNAPFRLHCRAALALLAMCGSLPLGAPIAAQTPAATADGTAASVQNALAAMQRPGGIVSNFPLAPRYYDVPPCHPLAATELALLNRWKADFDAASAAFDAALGAYATRFNRSTGAAGLTMAAGGQPPGAYRQQAGRLQKATQAAYDRAVATINQRTRPCPTQGGDEAGPTAWTPTTTTAPRPQPAQPPRGNQPPPAPTPPTTPKPAAPADVDPESVGLVSPTYDWGYAPEPPICFKSEQERQAYLDALADAHRKASANHAAVSAFLAQINSVVESYGARPVPPSITGLQAAARRDRNNFDEYVNRLFDELRKGRSIPICPPEQTGQGVGSTPGQGAQDDTPEQRAARLDALDRLRTGDANRSGTDVAPPSPRTSGDPSRDARSDAAERADEAERSRRQRTNRAPGGETRPSGTGTTPVSNPPTAETQPVNKAPGGSPPPAETQPNQTPAGTPPETGPTDAPPAGAAPPSDSQPTPAGPTATDPPPETQPAPTGPAGGAPPPETGQPQTGGGQGSGTATGTTGPGGTKIRVPERPRRPGRQGPPPQPQPAPPELETQPPPEETILDEIDEFGAAGELAYQNPLLDQLAIDFNKAVRECDVEAFLEVRERYRAELRRILSNPNLEARARAYFERMLKALDATQVPVRGPCPVIVR
jgi:hypothetical protein